MNHNSIMCHINTIYPASSFLIFVFLICSQDGVDVTTETSSGNISNKKPVTTKTLDNKALLYGRFIKVGMSSIVDKSTFSLCQLNRIEWLGIESK